MRHDINYESLCDLLLDDDDDVIVELSVADFVDSRSSRLTETDEQHVDRFYDLFR